MPRRRRVVFLALGLLLACAEEPSGETPPPSPEFVESPGPEGGEDDDEPESDALPKDDARAPSPEPPPPDLPPPPDPNGDTPGEVVPGGSLAGVLREAGLSPRERLELLEALAAFADPAKVQPGQRYWVTRRDDAVVAFTLRMSVTERVRVRRPDFDPSTDGQRRLGEKVLPAPAAGKSKPQSPTKSKSQSKSKSKTKSKSQSQTKSKSAPVPAPGWIAERLILETEVEEVVYAGDIEGSLWASLERAGADPTLVSVFVEAFAYDLNFHTDTRAGDHFEILVERELLDGEHVRYGRVLAAVYEGHGQRHAVYWWDPDGDPPRGETRKREAPGAYYDDEGHGVRRTFLKSPLKFTRVSSEFNPKRMHPVLHREKGHMGTDYAAPEGTPIWAAADGKIVVRADRGGAGNMVVVAHANGLKTLYMHLSRFEEGQKVGTRVEQKQVIGYVGMTGLATGPHLHFGVQKNGRYVDPQSVDVQRAADVPKDERKAFERHLAQLRERLGEQLRAQPSAPSAPAGGTESGRAGVESDATSAAAQDAPDAP